MKQINELYHLPRLKAEVAELEIKLTILNLKPAVQIYPLASHSQTGNCQEIKTPKAINCFEILINKCFQQNLQFKKLKITKAESETYNF